MLTQLDAARHDAMKLLAQKDYSRLRIAVDLEERIFVNLIATLTSEQKKSKAKNKAKKKKR